MERTRLRESERLRLKLDLVRPAMRRASARFMAHPDLERLYPEYLFAAHCVVRASVPLMEAALSRAASEAGGDPVARVLAEYLPTHIAEERDHDEWVLRDLETLGVARAAVLARPPSGTVAALVGAQYYWIEHYHPVALVGYMAVLEGNPPRPEAIDRIQARIGADRSAFRAMIEHAELDPGHMDQLMQTLDRAPLSREQSSVVGLSAIQSAVMIARLFDEMIDGTVSGLPPAATGAGTG